MHNIERLAVAVWLDMGVLQTFQHLHGDKHHRARAEIAPLGAGPPNDGPQVSAFDKLHGDEEHVVHRHQVHGPDDVDVIQGRRNQRFAQEQVLEFLALGEFGKQLLKDDLLFEATCAQLFADIDRPHAALG